MNVAVCFATADTMLGQALADYLKLHLDVVVDEVAISPWLDLLEALDSAAAADASVALLSPASLPLSLSRERWDAIKSGQTAWALVDECGYPRLLERRAFFDFRQDPGGRFKEVRRWLLRREARREPAPAACVFVDQPGKFAVEDREMFEAAIPYFATALSLDARGRSVTSLAAEMADLLCLDRAADRETLIADVRSACRERRVLMAVEGHDPGLFDEAGRSSIVSVPAQSDLVTPNLPEMRERLMACQKGRAEPPARADLDRALAAAFISGDWAQMRDLAFAAHSFLKNEYRLAEAWDLLESLRKAAEFYGDPEVMDQCVIDQVWIGERWSADVSTPDRQEGLQRGFAF